MSNVDLRIGRSIFWWEQGGFMFSLGGWEDMGQSEFWKVHAEALAGNH